MPSVSNELRDFHRFVGEKLANGVSGVSPEEALWEWRVEHPSSDAMLENLAALREALDEADRGEGLLLAEVVEELSRRHQLPSKSADD